MGSVHGSFAATVLDSVTGCAVFSMLEAGLSYTTIDLNIKMCRPIPLNTELKAVAKTTNISKNLAIAEAQLLDQDGKLYAHATATCMIIR
ncbi:PaaI family thioesterase [Acinetobacter terrestris]|nr:PaaI family thioesterase [Acinetobacter terrestris]